MNNLEFAIKMELDGEKYYLKQAEIYKNECLYPVFRMLAQDEKNHATILQNKFDNLAYELKDNDTLTESRNIFTQVEDFQNQIKHVPNQLDVYRDAMERERKSVELYKELFEEAEDDESKELFKFLIEQEISHFEVLEELVLFLSRHTEWVESAEFGLREEY